MREKFVHLGKQLSKFDAKKVIGGQNPGCWQECESVFWNSCTNGTIAFRDRTTHVTECSEYEKQSFCISACSNDPQMPR
jgi:hypothetical protein